MFDVHAFLDPNGGIVASGMVDPKAIYLASQYQLVAAPDAGP
ncbi:MAG TPA: hypothetical protein VD767_08270 [Thermomicrobiales bacterium]|nr:hypothetical protein [Thermomicrobiales bacterium]